MIIVPELKSVLITPPRTASSSLRKYLPEKFPKAITLSYHGEYNMIPTCFSDYQVVGVVRDPLERLNSLYNFIRNADPKRFVEGYFGDVHKECMQMTFVQWLVYNKRAFTQPRIGDTFYAKYNVHNVIPEIHKTYDMYFGPNAKYVMFDKISEKLDLNLPVTNNNVDKSLTWNETLDQVVFESKEGFCIFDLLVQRHDKCYTIFKNAQENSYV